MACDKCKLPYPDELLVPMFVGTGYTKPVCGICALAITNEIHGSRLKRFHGEMAEDKRQQALSWRGKHPRAQPVGAPS